MGDAPLCVLCRTRPVDAAVASVLQRTVPQRGPGAMGGRTVPRAGEPVPSPDDQDQDQDHGDQ